MSHLRDQQHATFPHKIPFGNLISDPPSWSNSVITRKYTRKRFISQVCFDLVLNPGYAWLLLAACVDCALVHKGYEGDLSTVLVVFLGALVRLSREIYQEYQRFALDSKVNSEVYKVWDGQEFQDKPRSRIQCGDLLLVDNGQQVAADCVLFASERPNGNCYVDNSSTLCSAEMTVKYAVSDIQRYAEGESFEKLTSSLGKLVGIMKIQAPNEDFGSFSGQLRLSKSPSAVLLTLTNFILRGSRVFGAKWVLCCVVATGMETKAMLNARPNRRNRSKFEEMVHKYTRFAIGISLAAIICNLIGYVSVESNHFTTQMVVWWSMSRYYRLVPGLLYLLIDLVVALQTLQSNHSPYFQGQITLNKVTSAYRFGDIDYVLADKNCVLTCNRPRVHTLIYRERLFSHCDEYYSGQHSCQQVRRRSKTAHAGVQDQCYLFTEKRLSGETGESAELVRDLHRDPGNSCGFRVLEMQLDQGRRDVLVEMLSCMVLCNTITQFDPLKARNKFEEALIECGSTFNFKVLERIGDRVILEIAGQRVIHRLIFSQYSARTAEEMMVIYDKTEFGPGMLYIRGPMQRLEGNMEISEDLREQMRIMTVELKRTGLTPIILAGKSLDNEALRGLKHRIWRAEAAIINVQSKLDAIFEEMKHNLTYFGMACVEDTLGTECSEGITKLSQAGVKVWVVSSDPETETLNSCASVGLFREEGYTVPITKIRETRQCEKLLSDLVAEFVIRQQFTSEDLQPMSKFRRLESRLEYLKNDLRLPGAAVAHTYLKLLSIPFDPRLVNYSIIIDSTSFETALKDDSTQCLLSALFFLATSVCFCSMLPHQKAKVVHFLKNSFAFHPTVLTLADGLSSLPMMDEGDLKVSIERVDFEEEAGIVDAKVVSLGALAEFIVILGRRWHRGMCHMVLLLIYENVLVVGLVVYYSGLCRFTVNSLLNVQCLWLATCLASKPAQLYIALFNRDIDPGTAVNYPEVYRWRNGNLSRGNIGKTVVMALVHAAVIFISAIIGLESAISSNGHAENGLILTGIVSISSFLTISVHIFTQYERLSLPFLLSLSLGGLVFLLGSIGLNYSDQSMQDYMEMTGNWSVSVLRMLLPLCFNYVISFGIEANGRVFSSRFGSFLVNYDYCLERAAKYAENLVSMWVPSTLWKPKSDNSQFERKSVLRSFKSAKIEEKYHTFAVNEVILRVKASYFLLTASVLICIIVSEAGTPPSDYLYLKLLFLCYCMLLLLFCYTKLYLKYYIHTNLLTLMVFIAGLGVYEGISGNTSPDILIAVPIFSFLHYFMTFFPILLLNILNICVYIVIAGYYIVAGHDSEEGPAHLINSVTVAIAVTVAVAVAGYFLDEMARSKFILLTTQEIELEKGANVLKYLLPDFVLTRVKNGDRFISDPQPQTHILFCDICDFDAMIKDYNAEEITTLLNKIFQKLDEICDSSGVTKIETVGRTYVACTGLKESEMDNPAYVPKLSSAHRLLYCAFEFLSAIEQFILPDGKGIRIKIGINSGKVIAGVVGYHKPQFSLVGDTVNTASRMCSTLDRENAIQISASTYQYVHESSGVLFEAIKREIKGKGAMTVYIVTKDMEGQASEVIWEASDLSSIDGMRVARRGTMQYARAVSVVSRQSLIESKSLRAYGNNRQLSKWYNLKHIINPNKSSYKDTLRLKKPTSIKGLAVVTVFEMICFIEECIEVSLEAESWETAGMQGGAALLLLLALLLSFHYFTRERFAWVVLGLLTGVFMLHFAMLLEQPDEDTVHQGYSLIILIIVVLVHFTGLRTPQLLPLVLAVSITLALSSVFLAPIQREPLRLAITLSIMCLYIVYICYKDIRLQSYIELKQKVQDEIVKTDELLRNLLPHHVLESLRLETAITDYLEDTTLLIADIVGFTSWSNEREPSEVIEMLSKMFSLFDKLCVQYKTYKVYTIGDCYIAMGLSGSKDQRDPGQECLRIVEMAFEMKKVIADINDEYFTGLDMRIGVHTGDLIGAVIGTNIVRYDIYGKDVLIGFKMEANSRPGMINLSASAKAMLESVAPNAYSYTLNTTVDIPAIGVQVPCYFTTVL